MTAPTGTKRTTLLKTAAVVSVAVLMGLGVADAGIKGSKHDLGSGGDSQYSAAGAVRLQAAAKAAALDAKNASDAVTSGSTNLGAAQTAVDLAKTTSDTADASAITARDSARTAATEAAAAAAAQAVLTTAADGNAVADAINAAVGGVADATAAAAAARAVGAGLTATAVTDAITAAGTAKTSAATTLATAIADASTASTNAAAAVTAVDLVVTDDPANATVLNMKRTADSSASVASQAYATINTATSLAASTSSSRPDATAANNTTEVCVFCHTPHGSDTSAAVPLWNKKLPSSGSYTTYDALATSTYDATQGDIGSVSLACLSCHDGTQAMDSMINAPGSGNYSASGASAYGFGKMQGTPIPNLGTDLKNDHPISMPYGGGIKAAATSWVTPGGTAAVTTDVLKDADFVAPFGQTINTNAAWWVNTTAGGSDAREKQDMFLYTRASGTGTDNNAPTPFVECASCHDPHNAATASGSSVAFLRISNASSAVCLACHNK